jgi:hypothetical protein
MNTKPRGPSPNRICGLPRERGNRVKSFAIVDPDVVGRGLGGARCPILAGRGGYVSALALSQWRYQHGREYPRERAWIEA